MILLPICVEPNELVREVHVCYYTSEGDNGTIRLEEVVECSYKHPEAPDNATISRYETRTVKRVGRSFPEAGVLVLMEANQKAIGFQGGRQ